MNFVRAHENDFTAHGYAHRGRRGPEDLAARIGVLLEEVRADVADEARDVLQAGGVVAPATHQRHERRDRPLPARRRRLPDLPGSGLPLNLTPFSFT